MKNAIVCGAGKMGTAIAYGLNKLELKVAFVDPVINEHNYRIYKDVSEIKDNVDIVISASPYHQNLKIAAFCAEKGWRYADLGGNPHISDSIRKLPNNKLVFTDLGLAPGLANLIAEVAVNSKQNKVENVEIQVGGLPVKSEGRLSYKTTWSYDGLFSEYSGACKVIKESNVHFAPALSDVEEIDFPDIGKLEAFHTRGALDWSIDSMMQKGVKNLTYKTLRYPGHVNYIDFLLNECRLTEHEFKKAIMNACPKTKEDIVFIRVRIDDETKYYTIKHNDQFTAMQISTAFPTAAISALLADGLLDSKTVLNYSDLIDVKDKITENLKTIDSNLPDFLNW